MYYQSGSTKSLLIFGRNLREGIPTLSTAEFPHRGGAEVSLQDISSGVLEPSAQVLLVLSSSGLHTLLESYLIRFKGIVKHLLYLFLFISIGGFRGIS